MSARFALDLLHPGHVADSWQDWFVGPQGARRLLIVAGKGGVGRTTVACALALLAARSGKRVLLAQTRSNGLLAMVKQMKNYALAFKIKNPAKV